MPDPATETPAPVQTPKIRMIDLVAERDTLRSVADIGGVWKVEAGYARHAHGLDGVEDVKVVDVHFTDTVRRYADRNPGFELIDADMGDPHTPARIGDVDLVLLYDVLLHQVDPDWNEILTRFAGIARYVAVAGPRWPHGDRVLRLPDLGRERYLEMVPPTPGVDLLFDAPDEPVGPRRRRDIHAYWQWGIPTTSISALMTDLGFATVGYEHLGSWFGSRHFTYEAALFTRMG